MRLRYHHGTGCGRVTAPKKPPDGVVIVHADRGSQFRARSFRAVLQAAAADINAKGQPPVSRELASDVRCY